MSSYGNDVFLVCLEAIVILFVSMISALDEKRLTDWSNIVRLGVDGEYLEKLEELERLYKKLFERYKNEESEDVLKQKVKHEEKKFTLGDERYKRIKKYVKDVHVEWQPFRRVLLLDTIDIGGDQNVFCHEEDDIKVEKEENGLMYLKIRPNAEEDMFEEKSCVGYVDRVRDGPDRIVAVAAPFNSAEMENDIGGRIVNREFLNRIKAMKTRGPLGKVAARYLLTQEGPIPFTVDVYKLTDILKYTVRMFHIVKIWVDFKTKMKKALEFRYSKMTDIMERQIVIGNIIRTKVSICSAALAQNAIISNAEEAVKYYAQTLSRLMESDEALLNNFLEQMKKKKEIYKGIVDETQNDILHLINERILINDKADNLIEESLAEMDELENCLYEELVSNAHTFKVYLFSLAVHLRCELKQTKAIIKKNFKYHSDEACMKIRAKKHASHATCRSKAFQIVQIDKIVKHDLINVAKKLINVNLKSIKHHYNINKVFTRNMLRISRAFHQFEKDSERASIRSKFGEFEKRLVRNKRKQPRNEKTNKRKSIFKINDTTRIKTYMLIQILDWLQLFNSKNEIELFQALLHDLQEAFSDYFVGTDKHWEEEKMLCKMLWSDITVLEEKICEIFQKNIYGFFTEKIEFDETFWPSSTYLKNLKTVEWQEARCKTVLSEIPGYKMISNFINFEEVQNKWRENLVKLTKSQIQPNFPWYRKHINKYNVGRGARRSIKIKRKTAVPEHFQMPIYRMCHDKTYGFQEEEFSSKLERIQDSFIQKYRMNGSLFGRLCERYNVSGRLMLSMVRCKYGELDFEETTLNCEEYLRQRKREMVVLSCSQAKLNCKNPKNVRYLLANPQRNWNRNEMVEDHYCYEKDVIVTTAKKCASNRFNRRRNQIWRPRFRKNIRNVHPMLRSASEIRGENLQKMEDQKEVTMNEERILIRIAIASFRKMLENIDAAILFEKFNPNPPNMYKAYDDIFQLWTMHSIYIELKEIVQERHHKTVKATK